MVRAWSLILGIGLVFLGLSGLGSTSAGVTGGSWMAWLDFVGAFLSFVVAGTARPEALRSGRVAGPGLISIGLFAMWLIALIIGNIPSSLVWWNFAFACAYGLVTIASGGARRPMTAPRVPGEIDREQRPPRRAA